MTKETGDLPGHHPLDGPMDETEEAIARLASEAFSVIMAIWGEPSSAPPLPFGLSGPWTEITRRILRCRAIDSAVMAVDTDPTIGPATKSGVVYAGITGSGGALQAKVLPMQLVECACMDLAARAQDLTARHMIESALENLRKLRTGIAGDTYDGWMLTAFRGVRLLPEIPISTPWGQLVHADRMSSEMWAPNGCSAVLATPIRTYLRPRRLGDPSDMVCGDSQQLNSDIQRVAQLVSYGLALGSSSNDPTTAVPISSGELLPIGMVGRSGAFRMLGLHNRQSPIGADEAADAVKWMSRLDRVALDRIELALRRLVRGLAERIDYLDSLVDAVIAWENLVESRDQPTKSVLYGIAALTERDLWSNRRISMVYQARSDVVHGEVPNYAKSKDIASDALRIGLDALRSLLDNHPDMVDMTSEQRVAALGFAPRDGDRASASTD